MGKLSAKQLNKIATTTFDNGGEALFDNNSSYLKNVYIYSKLSKVNDENVLIMLSTSIVPLQSTIDTMYDQFNIIIIVVVIATILLALCLSSLIVNPIKKIEMEATNLPSGKYDYKLIKTDAREIENLNNTLARANEEIIKADLVCEKKLSLHFPLLLPHSVSFYLLHQQFPLSSLHTSHYCNLSSLHFAHSYYQ